MLFSTLEDIGFGQFLIAVLLAAAVSMGIYWHAAKHGSKHPTAWGIATFLALGIVVPVYFIRYWVTRRRI